MIDGQAKIQAVQSIAVAAHNATLNGAGVDLASYDSATAYAFVGTWTDGSHTLKLQESADNSTWNDVAATDLIGAFAAMTSAPTTVQQKVGYKGALRYLRAVSTVSGATTGAVYGVYILGGEGRKLPLGA